MIRPQILHNGQIRPSNELILNPGQVGLLSGWGIFSTIKVVEGVLFEFNRHWARLSRDADLLRVPFPWTAPELEEMLLKLVEANQDFNATLRVAVVRNLGTMWSGPIHGTRVRPDCPHRRPQQLGRFLQTGHRPERPPRRLRIHRDQNDLVGQQPGLVRGSASAGPG
ncbi:MAG: aminotransferase class IV [Paludibaculum sp.]